MPVIKVENLSKSYIIGHQRQESYTALRDVMANGAKNLARKLLHSFNRSTTQRFSDSTEEFFALRDVSFEIKQGDRVGIIGRNGAGKSTLLKILSRITEPTAGRISITGRVASLLEVGTGFHPELTGRENIYLNGAILGMSRVDIKRKFDEIVAFAEVERFLDTPVKRYSSGMYVRLAFAVAAHLEPEVLIVDEVLAVGDAQFQKKCLGKMEEVGREGRTVLFVSHNMNAIEALCSDCVLLNNGQLQVLGEVSKVIKEYQSCIRSDQGQIHIDNKNLVIYSIDSNYSLIDDGGCKIIINVIFNVMSNVEEMYLDIGFENYDGVRLLQIIPKARGIQPLTIKSGGRLTYCIELELPELTPGDYFCTLYAHSETQGTYLLLTDSMLFRVAASETSPETMSPGFTSVLLPKYKIDIIKG